MCDSVPQLSFLLVPEGLIGIKNYKNLVFVTQADTALRAKSKEGVNLVFCLFSKHNFSLFRKH